MGEAKRRRQRPPTDPVADLGRVLADGAGLAGVELILRSDTGSICDCMRMGDPGAHWRGQAILQALDQIRRGKPQCLLCPTTLTTIDSLGAIAVIAGEVEHAGRTPAAAIISHVCKACCDRLGDRVAVTHAVRAYFTTHFDVQPVDGVVSEPGDGVH